MKITLNLGIRWRSVVSFTLPLFYFKRKAPLYASTIWTENWVCGGFGLNFWERGISGESNSDFPAVQPVA
jgi:hypothetical protein